MKQKLTELKGKIDNSTLIVGAFNFPLSVMDRTTWHKINREVENLNMTNSVDFMDICRTHHSATAEYAFFSGILPVRTFSK